MEILQDYIVPITLALCFCIGYIVKKWIDDVDNKYIPTIVAVAGVVVNVWVMGAFTPEVILGGLASGLASTGLDQLIRTNEKT